MDLSTRNAEVNLSRIRSCRHILQTAGIPYAETTSLTQALTNPVVMFSPIITTTTFNAAERIQIQQYVSNGGILIASSVRDPALYPLFGVTGYTNYTDLKRMTWDVNQAPQYFDRFDDGYEKVIALSDTTGPQTVNTFILRPYTITGGAQVLAHFENNTNAVITNQTGAGRTFLFAVDLRDVIIRNLINSDLHAQRAYSNIFEPTTDTFIFFIMNVVREHIPNLVRSHPCPNCDGSVVMITHDVDSRTAMDTMQIFINYEEANHLNGMYNITTRYFHDSWMTAFYVDSYDKVEYVRQHGQRLASHSVGHFPDYDNETLFPFTSLGNTPTNYQPRYFNSVTTGGNVYGEVEVSKYLLENDHQVSIKSFRAGHLAYNQRLPKALQDCGYLYNSTFSANDVLTNFPFWDIDNMTFSGTQTSILEIPMTISDASASNPFTEQNAISTAQEWVTVTQKNYNNNAPTVLLIHPNRGYKLPAEQYFVNNLPSDVKYMFLDDFGDYWKKRLNMQYETVLTNDTLKVTWSNYQMNQGLSFVIDDVAGLNAIRFFDGVGNELFPQSVNVDFGETRFCQFVYDESFEVCNGLDDDGDGNIDENLGYVQYQDNDNDEFGNPDQSVNSCFALVGYVTNNLDCDDNNTVVHPDNSEYCDHIDNNCDGVIDEGLTWNNYYADIDLDGFGNTLAMVEACIAPDNFILQPGDCNDDISSINPNASEICNDLDDNCDTNIDEGLQFVTYYEDLDQDGYGNDAVSVVKCVLPFGFVTLHGDCTDNAPAINPSAAELCGDGIDNNCDGQIDEGCIIDLDEDGFDATVDCDDENAAVNPSAIELCNSVDDDCDGSIDDGLTFVNYYTDADGDGYGSGAAVNLCANPGAGFVTNNTDCNDSNAALHAITVEVCNNFDDDCDGSIDDGLTFVNYYTDADGDGYGSGAAVNLCANPGAGFVTNNIDCNNNNNAINPGAVEICGNAVDEDCSGTAAVCVVLGCTNSTACNYNPSATNDNGSCTYPAQSYLNCNGTCINDTDGDGVCNELEVAGCTDATACNYNPSATNDNGSCTYPAQSYLNCNGSCINDTDGDGVCNELEIAGCTDAAACNYNPSATNDNGSCVFPSLEICNGVDDDCDGQTDENLTSSSIAAIAANSAAYPTCTTGNFFSANFNNASNSNALLENQGVAIWYKLTAVTNALRVGLSAAYGDNAIWLYRNNGGCLQLILEEHEVSSGNQILLSDQLVVGGEYYIAVQHLSGPINSSAKICINHFVGSTCDHVYSNGAGIYSSVCSPFKAQFRGSAAQYSFHVISATQQGSALSIIPWSYTTPSSSSIVSRLGSILPANLSTADINYQLRVDVNYSISDIAGNYMPLTAVANESCAVVLNAESPISLRATDRCPTTKSMSQSVSVDRTVCGALRYEWKLTKVLPTPAAPFTALGGLNSAVLFLNSVSGLSNNATYNLQVRPIHASGIAGEWGSVQCMKIGTTSGMILQPATINDQVLIGSKSTWTLYPNPSLDGNVTIASNGQEEMLHHLQLFDAMGRSVWKDSQVFGGSASFNLPDVSHGMYTLSIDGERIRCVIGTE